MHLNHNNNELAIAKRGCCPSVELAVGLFRHVSGVSILTTIERIATQLYRASWL